MAVISGFGVNYKGAQSNWTADMSYFNSIGLNNIRPHLAPLPIPWSNDTPSITGTTAQKYAYWRSCAQIFVQNGFWVTTGPSGPSGMVVGNLTATSWSSYATAVVAEATYLQQQGIVLGDFNLGNELEAYVDGTTLTVPQLHTNLRTLATNVKAVYTLSPVSYSCFNTSYSGGTTYAEWISSGLGNMDYISLHPYGNINVGAQTISAGGYNSLTSMVTAFGNKCYISEFNLDASDVNLQDFSVTNSIAAMNNFINNYILANGFSKFLAYSYVGYNNQDNMFALSLVNNAGGFGGFNPMWWSLFANEQKYPGGVYR